MKVTFLLSFYLLFFFLLLCPPARCESEADSESVEVSTVIPMEPQDKYQAAVTRAIRAFEEKDYAGAKVAVSEAMEVFPKDPFVRNLQGAILTKEKDYAGAREAFEECLALDPQYFPARFNIGETFFLEGDIEKALGYFEALRENYRDSELLNFKLVALFFLTGRDEDAFRTVKRMRFPGESPAWYYAQALGAAKEGKKGDAKKYRQSAISIFGKKKCELFEETIIESGLLR